MMFVLVPFVGDVSDLVSDMITDVYSVLTGSESAKVVICVNKCEEKLKQMKGQKLKDAHGNEKEITSMEIIKEHYIAKLNDYFKKSSDPFKQVAISYTLNSHFIV